MKPITICLTYFKSLTLANLSAALYSVSRQGFTSVDSLVIIDNDTADSVQAIESVILALKFSVPVRLTSFKHGDPTKTHSWSTNRAVDAVDTPWVFFTRADYLLDFAALEMFSTELHRNTFITSRMRHLDVDISGCEQTMWRDRCGALRDLPGIDADYTCIDTGVWLAQRDAFNRVGGMDERLSAWGHSQTEFQHRLSRSGVGFRRLDEVLFYHPLHAAPRDMAVANQQMRDIGLDIHDLWARFEGTNPY